MTEVWELLFWDDGQWITLGKFSTPSAAGIARDEESEGKDNPWRVLKVRKVGAHG